MTVHRITALDDPRLHPFLNMRDRNLRAEGDRFLAEGMLIVERAVAAGIELDSVLVGEGKLERVQSMVPVAMPLLVAADALMETAVGFALHQGVVAVGRVQPPVSLGDVCRRQGGTLVICPDLENVDNLGLLVRICAGLGVDALLLGPSCCDPWYRRAVRVSMGSIFRLPIVRSASLDEDLETLRTLWRYELIATVLDAAAQPLRETARQDDRFAGTAIAFGNEARGLDESIARQCHRRVRIPMAPEVDSLNVAVAAGIVIHHFTPPLPEPGGGELS